MEGLHASPDRMREAARYTAQRADDIEAGLGELYRKLNSLLGDGWQGRAASAYDHGWTEWHDGATKVVDALRESADRLLSDSNAYEAQEQQARYRLDGIAGQVES